MERIDVAVIGAGVTGLASARAIAGAGVSVCVLERHPRPGLDTSTHNSGVIHAGLYYPAGSLKARLCVEGRRLLYEFCATHDVPHARCGKLIVAHDEHEIRALEALQQRGTENGVDGLEIVDRAFIAAREPAVNTRFALWSPDTGIVNAEELVKALLRTGDGRRRDVSARARKLVGADRHADGMVLTTEREIDPRPRRRQRRRAVRRRGVAHARRRDVHDLSVPRRVRGVHAGEALAGQRARLSAAARVGPRPRRPPGPHDRRPGLARADDPVSGSEGRLRERPRAARGVRRSRRAG